MSDKPLEIRQAPKFTAIRGTDVMHDDNSFRVLFLAVDGQHYAIEIDAGIAPALIHAIVGHANELSSIHGGETVQALPVKSLTVAMAPDGTVALKILSESNLATVMSISTDHLPLIRAALSELDDLLDRKQH